MPDVSVACLAEDACVFAYVGDNRDGQPYVSTTGVNLKCHWESEITGSIGPDGTMLYRPVQVFVDREITVRSVMAKGKFADLPSSLTYYEVTDYSETPDIKGNNPTRRVTLAKYQSSLRTS